MIKIFSCRSARRGGGAPDGSCSLQLTLSGSGSQQHQAPIIM